MKTEQQRIALAEWEGWRWWKHTKSATFLFCQPDRDKESLDDKQMQWEQCKEPNPWPHFVSLHAVPDYRNDLNAVHSLENKLSADQYRGFRNKLFRIRNDEDMEICKCTSAPAAQRCEALCRVLFPDRWPA